jgi:hypothetical protein
MQHVKTSHSILFHEKRTEFPRPFAFTAEQRGAARAFMQVLREYKGALVTGLGQTILRVRGDLESKHASLGVGEAGGRSRSDSAPGRAESGTASGSSSSSTSPCPTALDDPRFQQHLVREFPREDRAFLRWFFNTQQFNVYCESLAEHQQAERRKHESELRALQHSMEQKVRESEALRATIDEYTERLKDCERDLSCLKKRHILMVTQRYRYGPDSTRYRRSGDTKSSGLHSTTTTSSSSLFARSTSSRFGSLFSPQHSSSTISLLPSPVHPSTAAPAATTTATTASASSTSPSAAASSSSASSGDSSSVPHSLSTSARPVKLSFSTPVRARTPGVPRARGVHRSERSTHTHTHSSSTTNRTPSAQRVHQHRSPERRHLTTDSARGEKRGTS